MLLVYAGLLLCPVNTKHLYNFCTMLDQRRRRWADVVQMLCKCLVFTGWRLTDFHLCTAGLLDHLVYRDCDHHGSRPDTLSTQPTYYMYCKGGVTTNINPSLLFSTCTRRPIPIFITVDCMELKSIIQLKRTYININLAVVFEFWAFRVYNIVSGIMGLSQAWRVNRRRICSLEL